MSSIHVREETTASSELRATYGRPGEEGIVAAVGSTGGGPGVANTDIVTIHPKAEGKTVERRKAERLQHQSPTRPMGGWMA